MRFPALEGRRVRLGGAGRGGEGARGRLRSLCLGSAVLAVSAGRPVPVAAGGGGRFAVAAVRPGAAPLSGPLKPEGDKRVKTELSV